MPFVRLIHREHYNARKRRFLDLAFKNSKDGTGISTVEYDCAVRASVTFCQHAPTYYPSYASPTIFWPIPEGIFPNESYVQETSTTGDDCHHNIKHISPGDADRIRKTIRVGDCRICDGTGAERQLTLADLPTA